MSSEGNGYPRMLEGDGKETIIYELIYK